MAIIKAGRVLLTPERAMLPDRQGATREHGTAVPSPGPAPCVSDESVRDDTAVRERAALNARIAELEARLAEHEAALESHVNDAFEQGAETARGRFVQAEAERVALLQKAVDAARGEFSRKLDALDALATEISLAALERVLGNPDDYARLVVATVRHRMTTIAEGSMLAVRVSATDFPDAGALEQIDAGSHVELVADPALQAGACFIDLQLGRIDASIPGQHARTANLLSGGPRDD
ncbi:hypothetical protein [Burkholderia sp. BCC1977]|uniref:FliH/SctL family protein n=1 Tax=Burkholderia sp. BCC1977 TaxID=2817440 RepID=UPI002ABE6259|nr:hypothetical protein [Burkholderia sp. BCC1977]